VTNAPREERITYSLGTEELRLAKALFFNLRTSEILEMTQVYLHISAVFGVRIK
jgi:hypothetical protein